MPLDALCLTAIKSELERRVVGAKIDKVRQPERDVVVLSLRGTGGSMSLLLSAGANGARVHLTTAGFENPKTPPMFCMLLRKHLNGARITAIRQPECERVLVFELDAYDELGVVSRKSLVSEMTGRGSNIILVGEDSRIIDCLRRVDAEMSEKRQILPGLIYRLPPAQDKLAFLSVSVETFRGLWESADTEQRADKWLLDNFFGLSPLICRELCYRAFGDVSPVIGMLDGDERARLPAVASALSDTVRSGEFTPSMLLESGGKPRDFSFAPVTQYENALETKAYADFATLLDDFYTKRDEEARRKRQAESLTKTVKNARDRLVRKLAAQRTELDATAGREPERRRGDLITANIYRLKKGDRLLTAQDFYNENALVEIPLDPNKTPAQNAALYFKRYNKLKSAEAYLTEQITKGERELSYLESVLDELSRFSGSGELSEIRRELEDSGFLRKQKTAKREKAPKLEPLRFTSDSGFTILAGRNNAQNDLLTLKLARRDDVWLHTQKIHGAHVIICCNGAEPDEETLNEAAAIAKRYSQAREGGKTPVDYTKVKYVKKPPGSLPGAVIYTDYKTIITN